MSASASLLAAHARWRMFGLMVVAMARCLLQHERAGRGDVWASAGTLEICLRAALMEISCDIAKASNLEPSLSEEAACALSHLRIIYMVLLAMALYLQVLQARQCRAGAEFCAPGASRAGFALPFQWAAAPIYAPPYLDSG